MGDKKIDSELDIVLLIKKILSAKKTVLKFIAVFSLIGLINAILSEKEFEASATFIPQTSGGMSLSGGLGGLAAMAGVNLGAMSEGSSISPELYPEIMNGMKFQKGILDAKINFKDYDDPITFREYFLDSKNAHVLDVVRKYTLGLPSLLLSSIKKKEVVHIPSSSKFEIISDKEKGMINKVASHLVLDVNLEDGTITLTGKMPEALAAAEFTDNAMNILQKVIIDIKIQKSKEQLKFIEKRYIEKKKDFKEIREKLAIFRDKNRNVNSSYAKTTLDMLESEYDLVYNIYSELAKQYETQRIKVKEDTPVFTIINAVTVPFEKSKPRRLRIILIWSFLGFVIGAGSIFGKEYFYVLKKKFEENKY